MNNYYLIIDGQKKGPYTETRIRNMWKNNHIDPGTECLKEGDADPRPIEEISEITSPSAIKKSPAPTNPTPATSSNPTEINISNPSLQIIHDFLMFPDEFLVLFPLNFLLRNSCSTSMVLLQ